MQTRRRFLQAGLTAAAAGALTPPLRPARAAERPGRKPGFELSVASYTFRKFDLAQALAQTRRVGISQICLKSFHLPMDSSAEACAAAARTAREVGVTIWGGGVITMKTPEQVEQAFSYAQAAGMSCIVGVPHPEVLARVEQKVKELNIRVAIHNHGPGDTLYPRPQDALAWIKDRDARLGVCVDVGHTTRIGGDPVEAIRACGHRVLDIHLKDVTGAEADAHEIEIGRGIVDIAGILAALRAVNYRGLLSFEHEKDPDGPLPGLAESVGYVRGVLAATG